MGTAVVGDSHRGRLLLVDDEENILRSLRRVLRSKEWEIEVAASGEGALTRFADFKPQVVISDFRMPGLNGVDLLTQMKALAPNTQRILLTGHADQLAMEDAINRSEVFRFVTKPWNDAQLVSTVRSAFDQHRLQTENERLYRLTQEQNAALRQLNTELELRVEQRSAMLSRAERDWEASFDAIETPMMIIERERLVVRRANRAAADVAGSEPQGQPRCHEFLFDRAQPCEGCPLTGDLKAARSSEIRAHGRSFVAQAFPMGTEPVAVCTYRDVTEERSLTRRLIESEKMVAIGNLAGGVAHEINNPLGGILAFAQLMKRDANRSERDQEQLGLIEESALRCKRIVESLLKFSRQAAVEERRVFDLSRCVEDALVLFRAQARKHPKVTVDSRLDAGLLVFGDSAELAQVVLHLLRNGLQALRNDEGALSVISGRLDQGAYFRVSDTGCGIPEEHLSRIFDPHFTTKPPGQGTGLGLSIAYRIVQSHGGHFAIDSRVGAGSSFTVTIPLHESVYEATP